MKVSVCMATYNGEKYIKEQLESILNQLDEEAEVVISDDHSTDNTLEIARCFSDSRIKIFTNTKNKGYAANFENALEQASGDVIFLSDQDDVWLKDKVSIFLEHLKTTDFVVSNNTVVDAYLKTLHESHFALYGVTKGFFKNLLFPRYVGACMAFNNKVLQASLPFPSNRKLAAHDYWICLVAELFFKTQTIEVPCMLYRRHDSNASTGGIKSKNSLTHKMLARAYVIYHLIKRAFR